MKKFTRSKTSLLTLGSAFHDGIVNAACGSVLKGGYQPEDFTINVYRAFDKPDIVVL